jgi:predicted AAA+ superfamily ATPase
MQGICLHRSAAVRQIHFIVSDNRYPVCYSLNNERTRKREINSLIDALKEQRMRNATIVTFEEEETIDNGDYHIDVIPAYKFFLQEMDDGF